MLLEQKSKQNFARSKYIFFVIFYFIYILFQLIIVEPNAEDQDYLPVHSDTTLEICLVKPWSDPGQADVDFKLTFYGEQPITKPINFVRYYNFIKNTYIHKISFF